MRTIKVNLHSDIYIYITCHNIAEKTFDTETCTKDRLVSRLHKNRPHKTQQ